MAASIVIAVATHYTAARKPSEGPQPGRNAIELWWTSAGDDVHDLQNALTDTDEAIQRGDSFGIAEGCQHMHDAAAVNVPAHLPSPDKTLTAELTAADQDSHAAAHMCLAIFAHSRNGYSAEFESTSDQAKKHVAAALALVEQALTS